MHWVAFYLPYSALEPIEFFDSFGQAFNTYSDYFTKFVNRHYKKWIFNNIQLQSNISDVCGQYCCVYALYKSENFGMKKFQKLFDRKKFQQNDCIIIKLFKKYFKSNHCFEGKLCYPLQKCFSKNENYKRVA